MSGERRFGARTPNRSDASRGQTPIDFAVGAGVFLITLAFVIAFVPTLFDPFSAAETASPVVGDRAAASLTGDLLAASPATPGVLDPTCTVAFFAPTAGAPTDDCRFDADPEQDPAAHFGLDREVQVIIHALNETSPSQAPTTTTFVAESGTYEDITLIRPVDGPSGTASDDIAVSQRVVSLDGKQYRLTVRVW